MANSYSIDIEASSEQYLYENHSSCISITGDITIESWIKLESLPGSQGAAYICSKSIDLASDQSYKMTIGYFNFGDYTANIEVKLKHQDGVLSEFTWTTTTSSFPVDTWLYFAFRWNQSTKAWAILKGTTTSSPSVVASGTGSTTSAIVDAPVRLLVGADRANADGPAGNIDGKMDEFRLWAEARSDANLQANYMREIDPNSTNLRAYYRFNNSYSDSTSNGNTLIPSGAPVFSTDVPFTDNTTTSTSTTSTSSSTSTTTTSTSTTSTSSSTSSSTTATATSSSTSTTTTSTSTSQTSTSSTTSTTSTLTSTTTTIDLKFTIEKL